MPIGCYAAVPYVAHHLCVHRPTRILDLGMGFGGNGCTVRQWLDLGVRPWKSYLVGVEVWANYRNPLWDLYNLIVVDTIQNYLESYNESFDCILFTDVIEHFDKDDGLLLINRLMELLSPSGTLLIGTPAEFFEQRAVYGNQYEQHRSAWKRDDFEQLGLRVSLVGERDFFCGQALLAVGQRSPSGHQSPELRTG